MWTANSTEATNATQERNAFTTTEKYITSSKDHDIMYVINRITFEFLCWCGAVLSLAAFIFGLVSWIIIPKWRHFRNYVLQNIIFCCLIYTSCPLHIYFTTDIQVNWVLGIVFAFIVNVFVHWLVVATVLFYIDLVKVFNNNFKHKFLISTLFAWIIPVIVTLLFVYTRFPPAYLTTAETVLNFFLYIRVLISLCYIQPGSASRLETCQTVLFATLAFFITGFLLFFPTLIAQFCPSLKEWALEFVTFLSMVTAILIGIFFVFMKSNRTLWIEYWIRKRNFRHNAATLSQ